MSDLSLSFNRCLGDEITSLKSDMVLFKTRLDVLEAVDHTGARTALGNSISTNAANIADMELEKGQKGASVTGAKGEAGIDGTHGNHGKDGAKGETGAGGVKGETGAGGVKGETGAGGVKGETGAGGVKGETGAGGVKGKTGAGGVKGETGAKGETGTTPAALVKTTNSLLIQQQPLTNPCWHWHRLARLATTSTSRVSGLMVSIRSPSVARPWMCSVT